jgi:alpha-tubulin suppressor-like RCC1 family protein
MSHRPAPFLRPAALRSAVPAGLAGTLSTLLAVLATGCPSSGAECLGVENFDLGASYTCAVRDDGALFCWGSNGLSVIGSDCPGPQCENPVQIGEATDWEAIALLSHATTLGGHTCGLRAGGALYCWGMGEHGQLGLGDADGRRAPTRVGQEDNWQEVAIGSFHTCGVRADGSLWCWGDDGRGQLGLGDFEGRTEPARVEPADGWTSVSLGREHTCGLRTDGTLWCWGANQFGQLGNGGQRAVEPAQVGDSDDWIDVVAGIDRTCGIRRDGSLWCWGDDGRSRSDEPQQIGELEDWETIQVGPDYLCGERAGLVMCWGENDSGQLGLGDFDRRHAPVAVYGQAAWTAVAVASNHSCARSEDGSLWCWGGNFSGQLGLGDRDPRNEPSEVCL